METIKTIDLTSMGSGYTIGTPTSGSSVTWNSPNTWTTSNSFNVASPLTVKPSGTLTLQGEDADIDINGVSLMATLKRIEERINILTVNGQLESEWEELRELGDQYRALEQRIKDKMATWAKLNATDKDNR